MPGSSDHLVFSGVPASVNGGEAFSFTVTATNPDGTTDTTYTGAVFFTSSDPAVGEGAGLPAICDFTGHGGVATFSAYLLTPGAQTITATDNFLDPITGLEPTGTSDPIAVAYLLTSRLAAAHYTAGTGAAPPTLPTVTARSVVVGNAGGLPVPGFRFDGDEPGYLDEALVARLEPEHCTLQQDLSVLYREVRLQGGAATLLPDGARITGLATLCGLYNYGGGPYGFPYMSEDRDQFTDALCCLTWDAGDGGSGLAYQLFDGALYRWPVQLQAPHLCLALMTTTTDATFAVGTPHGVYTRTADPTDTTTAWARSGDFARRVTRIAVTYTASGPVLWALVQEGGSGSGTKSYHGIYRNPPYSAAAAAPHIEGGWQPVVRGSELIDMVASGPHDVWYLAKADPGNVHHLALDEGGPSATDTAMALPSGSQGTHLSYVSGAPGHDVAAVYCSVAGAASPLYWSDGSSGSWADFADADAGGALRDPSGATVGVNNVVTSTLTFLGWSGGVLDGTVGQYVAAFACATSGLFWTAAIGGSAGGGQWRAATGASGLADISVGDVSAGQWIMLTGQPTNRVYVTNSDRLYVSHTATNLWDEAAPHTPLTVGPALSALVYRVTGRLPDNMVKTIGPMASSPLSDYPNTHVCVPGLLPDGWWWQRTLDQTHAWAWGLVNGAVQTPRIVQQPISDLAADASARTALLSASGRLAEVATVYLGEHSLPRLSLVLQTTFTTAEAAARRLRATMQVPVRYHGQMLARASDGSALQTVYVSLDDAPFYVKSVRFASSSELGPGACSAVVELSTSLAEDRSADQIASALIDSLAHAHKTRRGRR